MNTEKIFCRKEITAYQLRICLAILRPDLVRL